MATAGFSIEWKTVSGATNRLALLEVGSWKKLDILQDAGRRCDGKIRCGGRGLFNNGRLLASAIETAGCALGF